MTCAEREQKWRLRAKDASNPNQSGEIPAKNEKSENAKVHLRARSSPLIAFSSCFSKTRSFEMYRLCVLVFHPGGGPAV